MNVAGASAGAIVACYLAVGHSAADLTELLRETPFARFQDFPGGSKFLGGWNLLTRHGFAYGRYFEHWFDDVLGGATFADFGKKPEVTGASRTRSGLEPVLA